MADIKAKEEVVPRSPNWQNYLGMLTGEAQPQGSRQFFPAGSNTLGRDQMETGERIADKDRASRESMHSSDLANRYKMHSESLALQKWIAEQRNELDWAEYNAALEALRGTGSADGIGPNEAAVQGVLRDYSQSGLDNARLIGAKANIGALQKPALTTPTSLRVPDSRPADPDFSVSRDTGKGKGGSSSDRFEPDWWSKWQ